MKITLKEWLKTITPETPTIVFMGEETIFDSTSIAILEKAVDFEHYQDHIVTSCEFTNRNLQIEIIRSDEE